MGEENGRDEKADAAASYCMLAALDAEGHWMTTTSTPAACKLLHAACSYVQRVMHARTHARSCCSVVCGWSLMVSGVVRVCSCLPSAPLRVHSGVRALFGFPCFTAMRGPALSPICSSCQSMHTSWHRMVLSFSMFIRYIRQVHTCGERMRFPRCHVHHSLLDHLKYILFSHGLITSASLFTPASSATPALVSPAPHPRHPPLQCPQPHARHGRRQNPRQRRLFYC